MIPSNPQAKERTLNLNEIRILLRDYVRKDSRFGTFLTQYLNTGQLLSQATQGTAPLIVTSTTQVDNLNAQYLGGHALADFVLEDEFTLSSFTTDDLAEGSVNQYLTTERIDDRIAAFIAPGSGLVTVYDDAGNSLGFFGIHSGLSGLLLDDHTQYLLASDATSRVLFAANWLDLTDAGATTLHKHDHGNQDGLGDDDHSQYVLASGARNITGDQIFEADITGQGSGNITGDFRVAGDIYATNIYGNIVTDGSVDHGSLGGLTDDDHGQYLLTSGARTVTGNQTFGQRIFVASDGTNYSAPAMSVTGSTSTGVVMNSNGMVALTTAGQGRVRNRSTRVTLVTPAIIGEIDNTDPPTNLWIVEGTADTTPTVEIENQGNGDAGLQFSAGAAGFCVGVDNSDSDKMVIGYGNGVGTAIIGTNNLMTFEASTTGRITILNSLTVNGSGVLGGDVRTSGDVFARNLYGNGAGLTGLVTDHGVLTGLSDDDHTQYILANGTRNITGDQTFEQDVVVQGSGIIDGDIRCGSNVFADVYYGDGSNLTNLPSSGMTFWTTVPGNPVRASNTTFTITGNYTTIFCKKVVLKWTESSTVRQGMVSIPSTYGAPNTTVTIIGDTMASIDAGSLKYTFIEPTIVRFAIAGTIGATGTNVANAYYADEPYRVFGADLQVGTAGTTNNTTIDINSAGNTIFTTKPTLATTVAASPTPFTADTTTSLALNAKVTIDVDAVQTTAAVDLYVALYLFPDKYQYLT